jgi:hypothetical protein
MDQFAPASVAASAARATSSCESSCDAATAVLRRSSATTRVGFRAGVRGCTTTSDAWSRQRSGARFSVRCEATQERPSSWMASLGYTTEPGM